MKVVLRVLDLWIVSLLNCPIVLLLNYWFNEG